MGRKRKCPLQPKQVEEDLSIIEVLDESSSSSLICLTSDSGIQSCPSSAVVEKSSKRTDRPVLKRSQKWNQVVQGSVNSFRTSKTTEVSSPFIGSLSGVRNSPLPHFSWADATEVWDLMVKKDDSYPRNPLLMSKHPSLQSRMRSILIDWLSEVCEVYKLHRETFYLAVDFIDRYLTVEENLPKQQLQLIGITCLFISAKIEEIYPPKLNEFAYVTDGACSESDILDKELVVLKSLRWDLVPMTVNGWLCVYMQLFSSLDKENDSSDINKTVETSSGNETDEDFDEDETENRKERKLSNSSPSEPKLVSKINYNKDFMVPGYPSQFFAQVAHLLDLSILDVGSLTFAYSVMAAAALYHFTNENIVFQCTGLKLPQIRECVVWMTPFALAIRDEGFENPKLFKSSDDRESFINIQSHTADLDLLEKAQAKQQDRVEVIAIDSTPVTTSKSSILTPPKSSSKSDV